MGTFLNAKSVITVCLSLCIVKFLDPSHYYLLARLLWEVQINARQRSKNTWLIYSHIKQTARLTWRQFVLFREHYRCAREDGAPFSTFSNISRVAHISFRRLNICHGYGTCPFCSFSMLGETDLRNDIVGCVFSSKVAVWPKVLTSSGLGTYIA